MFNDRIREAFRQEALRIQREARWRKVKIFSSNLLSLVGVLASLSCLLGLVAYLTY